MAALSLMSAATTGNNLLYLLFSLLLSALLIPFLAGRANLKHLRVTAEPPGLAFHDCECSLSVIVENTDRWSSYGILLSHGGQRLSWDEVSAKGLAAGTLRFRPFHRGRNHVEGVFLESLFPFGLLLIRRAVSGLEVLALPRMPEVRSGAEVEAGVRAEGRPTLSRGRGDELFGIREYDRSDDSRLINWKLTARSGRPLINEFCSFETGRVAVKVETASGPEGERCIEAAAAACRFYIDAGAEVSLVTPEESMNYGKGLLHLERILKTLALLGPGKEPRAASSPPPAWPAAIVDSTALRRVTFLGAGLVSLGLFLVDEIQTWMPTAILPVLLLGWLLYERKWPRVPRGAWNALSLLVLVYLLAVDLQRSGVVVANIHLLIYLIANRALDEVKTHELGQSFFIFLLAFFLISGLTISPWYFLFFLLYAGFAALWLALAHGGRWEALRAWRGPLSCRLAAVLACSALLFASVPRVEGFKRMNPFLSAVDKLQVKSSSVMGFTENVSLGFFGRLKKSSARVMKVKPYPEIQAANPPPLRVRGSALDHFDGARWSKEPRDFRYQLKSRVYASTSGRGWALRQPGQLLFPTRPPSGGGPSYEFMIYPMSLSVLFSVGTPWMVETGEAAAYFDHMGSAYFAAPYISGVRYRVYSDPEPGRLELKIASDPGVAERFLQLPPFKDGRVQGLAQALTGNISSDWGKARAIEAHLRKKYHYSTFSDAKDKSLEDFFFNSKRGNCEYFATAGVVLLREAGIPARLVTGFLADNWNEFGKFYDVRQEEAHAWVEAYIQGQGWVALDPTPGQSLFSASADVFTRRLERYWDALQVEWYRRVIGYDQQTQSNTFKRLVFRPEVIASLGERALWILSGGLLLWGLTRARLFLRHFLSAAPRSLFHKAQAALERAGLPRKAFWTPREYAREVMSLRPDLAALGPLAELYYLERFSPRGLSAEESLRARRLWRELSSRL